MEKREEVELRRDERRKKMVESLHGK